MVVNSRKALGLPAHYCGNVVSLQSVERASSSREDLTDRALKVGQTHTQTDRQRRGWLGGLRGGRVCVCAGCWLMQVRAACVVSLEEVMADHTYMESMRRQGRIKARTSTTPLPACLPPDEPPSLPPCLCDAS